MVRASGIETVGQEGLDQIAVVNEGKRRIHNHQKIPLLTTWRFLWKGRTRGTIVMPRVIHFEIHAGNPGRAVKFYRDLFGWEFTKWEGPMPYWLIKTGPDGQPGINGGMLPRRDSGVGPDVIAYVCTVDVPALDDFLKKAEAGGATVVVPKMPIPGVG
jgi:predicted enzyme related to lactoylglutathione lyase